VTKFEVEYRGRQRSNGLSDNFSKLVRHCCGLASRGASKISTTQISKFSKRSGKRFAVWIFWSINWVLVQLPINFGKGEFEAPATPRRGIFGKPRPATQPRSLSLFQPPRRSPENKSPTSNIRIWIWQLWELSGTAILGQNPSLPVMVRPRAPSQTSAPDWNQSVQQPPDRALGKQTWQFEAQMLLHLDQLTLLSNKTMLRPILSFLPGVVLQRVDIVFRFLFSSFTIHTLFPWRWTFILIMAIISQSWAGVVSFIVFLLFAFPADALPKQAKTNTASTAKSATGAKAATGAIAAGGAAASAGGISTATDGSTILDKTVTIKYIFILSFLMAYRWL
jgi:hypothetical protein